MYSREQIIKETQVSLLLCNRAALVARPQQSDSGPTQAMGEEADTSEGQPPWGLISIKPQLVDYEIPMQPITMMRNVSLHLMSDSTQSHFLSPRPFVFRLSERPKGAVVCHWIAQSIRKAWSSGPSMLPLLEGRGRRDFLPLRKNFLHCLIFRKIFPLGLRENSYLLF